MLEVIPTNLGGDLTALTEATKNEIEAARQILQSKQITFLVNAYASLAQRFVSEEAVPEYLQILLESESRGARYSAGGFRHHGHTIFEVTKFHSCETGGLTQDVYDSSSTTYLYGIGFEFEGGQVIVRNTVHLSSQEWSGFSCEEETDFSSEKYGYYTPQILDDAPYHLLTSGFSSIQFLPKKGSSLIPFAIEDGKNLSVEQRAGLQGLVSGVVAYWKQLGVRSLVLKDKAERDKSDDEARQKLAELNSELESVRGVVQRFSEY
jgi:hypothetical protein